MQYQLINNYDGGNESDGSIKSETEEEIIISDTKQEIIEGETKEDTRESDSSKNEENVATMTAIN